MDDRQRIEPARVADERTSLSGFLQYQRETLAWKCTGLTAGQLRERAVPPSALSLLGLVRHMAQAERSWFQNAVNGEAAPPHWPGLNPGHYAEFDVDFADPEESFRVWEEECRRSRATIGAAESLDTVVEWRDETLTLRYIITHMIEEYARHNGHADLLRERIDGATGE
ncbi:DinB family protein [Streptomyces vinaceus]